MALRFSLAERVLISSPMWNFGVPYKLKQWFDLIVQPGLTFTFSPAEGYRGLVKDRPTIVILASGSDFVTGMNRGRVDMATPYLRDILRFIGVHSVRFVAIGPTAGSARSGEGRARSRRTAAHRPCHDILTAERGPCRRSPNCKGRGGWLSSAYQLTNLK